MTTARLATTAACTGPPAGATLFCSAAFSEANPVGKGAANRPVVPKNTLRERPRPAARRWDIMSLDLPTLRANWTPRASRHGGSGYLPPQLR